MTELLARIEPLDIRERSPTVQRRIAQQVLELLARDYDRVNSSGDMSELLELFDPSNDELVEQQRRKLVAPSPNTKYWDIKVDTPSGQVLDGFAKTGEWRRGDQAPFEKSPRLTGALGRLGVVKYHATGLFAFVIDEADSEEISQAAMTSGLKAVRSMVPTDEELRAAVDLEDNRLNQAFDELGALSATRTSRIALGRYERDYGLRVIPPADSVGKPR